MKINFDSEAVNPFEQAPIAAIGTLRFDSMEAAHASITAVWKQDADRLMRSAYRLVHRFDTDVESLVADALIWALENWQRFQNEEHCRTALRIKVRHLCLHVIRDTKRTVEADNSLADPNGESDTTTQVVDATVNMLYSLCADDTERRILTIWLLPGNQTRESVVEATKHWLQPWSVLDVSALFERLRGRMQAAASAEMRAMLRQPMTKGTLPGHGWERHKALGSVVMLVLGPRELTQAERIPPVPRPKYTPWEPLGNQVIGRQYV